MAYRDRALQTQSLDDRGGVLADLLKCITAIMVLGVAVAPEIEGKNMVVPG
jgi:hypothetical protein